MIYLRGIIGKDITLKKVEAIFAANPDEKGFRLNSLGGSVVDGYDIFVYLEQKALEWCEVVGNCGSIATILPFAVPYEGRRIHPLATVTVHESRYEKLTGDLTIAKLHSAVDELSVINNQLLDVYESTGKLSREEWSAMLEKETILNADKAVEYGMFSEKTNLQNKMKGFLAQMRAFLGIAKNVMLELPEGGELYVDSEDADLIGKPVYLGENAAPDGEHILADGRVLVSENGLVKEIREAAPSATMGNNIETEMEELKNEADMAYNLLKAAKAEIERLKQDNVKATGLLKEAMAKTQEPVKVTTQPKPRMATAQVEQGGGQKTSSQEEASQMVADAFPNLCNFFVKEIQNKLI